jgi:hypothetical protein
MPFAEIFVPQELSDAVQTGLAETPLVMIMNIGIGYPADLCTGARLDTDTDTVPHSTWNLMGSRPLWVW